MINIALEGFKEFDSQAEGNTALEEAQVKKGTRLSAQVHVGEEYLAEVILHEFLHAFFAARIALGESNDMKKPELQALVKTAESFKYMTGMQAGANEISQELTEKSYMDTEGYEIFIDTHLVGGSRPLGSTKPLSERNPGAARLFIDNFLRTGLQKVNGK